MMEEDPEHGGLFMALDGHAHTLDLFPAPDTSIVAPRTGLGVGVHHVAFQVDSEAALREAHRTLKEHGVTISWAVDHGSQQSINFPAPSGNLLETYYELPTRGLCSSWDAATVTSLWCSTIEMRTSSW